MAHCDDIAPLLSAFNDGELSPHESNQVAEHLNGCEVCKSTVLDYLLLGHHLRTATPLPDLGGFTERVMEGIAGTRRPLRDRLLNRLEAWRERWVAAVSVMGAAMAVAALAMVLAGPHSLPRVADVLSGSSPKTATTVSNGATNVSNTATTVTFNDENMSPTPDVPPFVPDHPSGEAYISRLEARPASVATWSEPDTKTTVIWLADDTSGND